MATTGSGPHVGKVLELKSPFGEESITYKWPLKKGKGSVRRSEDKEDEAGEILETIRWVCTDHPDIEEILDKTGALAGSKYDPTSFDAMEALCNAYNKAVDKSLVNKKKTSWWPKPHPNFKTRCTRPHLKHILQKCYNKSVADPNLLNHYEAFTPEVYGETSFELICQILDKLHPISPENKFVDLGSGVGQVVLQVAALTDCEMSFGIEKANTPANYALDLERWFKFWMKFYGKTYSKFKLSHGDFLEKQHRADVLQSTIVFVNNFAFGPEVDQHLKDIFADLIDGARIFSSKSFCALNFRITDRNLSDIGTIMHVSKMDPLKGSVSWTGKPVSYYLHVIDRARLERYFQKSAARHTESDNRRRRAHINQLGHRANGEIEDSSLDVSMDVSKDNSRASSVEHDAGSLKIETTSKNSSDDEDNSNTATNFEDSNKLRQRRGRKGKNNLKSLRDRPALRFGKQSSLEDSNDVPMTDSNSSTPPPVAPPPTGTNSTSSSSAGTGNEETGSSGTGNSVSRPVRTAAAMANAISEAQSDMKKRKDLGPGGRKKRKDREKIASRISGLDLLHDTTMNCIEASNKDVSAPAGCVNERLNSDHPKELVHEELSASLVADDDGKPIPFQLQVHLDKLKRQYLSFIRHMQDPKFKDKVKADIEVEQKKKTELMKREKQLKSQIDNLITDSLNLLKTRLSELGIQAKTPPEFIEKAKGIVCQHHELQRNKVSVENEVRQLELEQEKIIHTKEKEMLEHLLKQGMNMTDARRRVRVTIENTINALQGADNKVSPLLNKLADVTLTKCEQLPSSTQIRKRPVIAKQRDWPEKKIIKDEQNPAEVAKIEEKNPEMLAKKIIAQGRSLEKSKDHRSSSSAATMISPRKQQDVITSQQPQQPQPQPRSSGTVEVEVRRIEQQHQNKVVDLPRVDLTSTLTNVQNQQQRSGNILPNNGVVGEPALVLPPHPRSRSSEHTEDITYNTNKMSSTPRAEQFEDRLKTIINSVLSKDETKDVKPPVSLSTSSTSNQNSSQKPMFSPVKKELPTHLPLPPSGVVISATSVADKYKRNVPPQTASTGSSLVSLPQMGSARTMNEIIEKEIERNLNSEQRRGVPSVSAMSPQKLSRPSMPGSASSMSRMSQVIEETIRGGPGARGPSELEGLACPRTKSPLPSGGGPPGPPPGVPASSKHPASFRHNTGNGDDYQDYPTMEGLGARFGPYMTKRVENNDLIVGPPPVPGGRNSHPNKAGPMGPNAWDSQHPNSAYGYRSAHFQQQQQPPSGSHPPGPPPMGSSGPPGAPPPFGNSVAGPPRKRASPSSSMPVLPPKKQHVDSVGGVDYSFHKDEDCGRKWQDEINSGFDRLVAYATEVDKRRKSTDSSNNSPVRPNSGLSGHDDLSFPGAKDIIDDVFEGRGSSSNSSNAYVKFKSGSSGGSGSNINAATPYGPIGVVSANSPYARSMPVHNSSKSYVPSALASVASLDDVLPKLPGHDIQNSKSPLPGENLPEHHFKKRYFAENATPTSKNGSPPLSSSP